MIETDLYADFRLAVVKSISEFLDEWLTFRRTSGSVSIGQVAHFEIGQVAHFREEIPLLFC